MVRSPATFHSVGPSATIEVLVNVQVGWFSTSKKSLVRRWLSRFSSRVSTLVASMVSADLRLRSGPRRAPGFPRSVLKRPRTLDTAMCRTANPTWVWDASMAYVPTAGYSAPLTILLVTSVAVCSCRLPLVRRRVFVLGHPGRTLGDSRCLHNNYTTIYLQIATTSPIACRVGGMARRRWYSDDERLTTVGLLFESSAGLRRVFERGWPPSSAVQPGLRRAHPPGPDPRPPS